jgi:hypothetical protein
MNQKAQATLDAIQLNELIKQIDCRDAFVTFVQALLRDLQQRPEEWENRDLATFLSAMVAWVEDMDGYYQNLGEAVPAQPTWKTLGQMLLAARVYE